MKKRDQGKGSVQRPYNSEKFRSEWERIFAKKEENKESKTSPKK